MNPAIINEPTLGDCMTAALRGGGMSVAIVYFPFLVAVYFTFGGNSLAFSSSIRCQQLAHEGAHDIWEIWWEIWCNHSTKA